MIDMQKTLEQTIAERKAELAAELSVKKQFRNLDRIAYLQRAIRIIKTWIK